MLHFVMQNKILCENKAIFVNVREIFYNTPTHLQINFSRKDSWKGEKHKKADTNKVFYIVVGLHLSYKTRSNW